MSNPPQSSGWAASDPMLMRHSPPWSEYCEIRTIHFEPLQQMPSSVFRLTAGTMSCRFLPNACEILTNMFEMWPSTPSNLRGKERWLKLAPMGYEVVEPRHCTRRRDDVLVSYRASLTQRE